MFSFVAFFATLVGVSAYGSSKIRFEQMARSSVEIVEPQVRAAWDTWIAQEVAQAGNVDGPFPAPSPLAGISVCDSLHPTCGVTAGAVYSFDTGSGSEQETSLHMNRAVAPTPNAWSAAPPACTAAEGDVRGHVVVTISAGDGSTIATRSFHLETRTICESPYIASGAMTDDSAKDLVGPDGVVRTAGRSGGCDAADPQNCDTLTASLGNSASASDTNVHAALVCMGVYCTGANGAQSIDNFQNKAQTNAGAGGINP